MSDDQVEPADAAAEAFEGLTSEISRLGVKVDALMAAATLKDATPDYALTLGAISQTLKTISAHPHISQSPESYQAQGLRAVEEARNLTRRDTDQIVQQFKAAAADLDRRGKAARERRAQLEWMLMAGALGLFLGVLVWGQGSGPLARALPPSWRIPETLAAATLNMDRWDAGARLMRVENPSEWAAILEGAKIERENRSALLTCWAAAQRAGRPQRCTISVKAEP